jgi:protein PhnA
MTNLLITAYPLCGTENTYPDADNFICPDCSHEWSATAQSEEAKEKRIHKDAQQCAQRWRHITLIKDLKVKGSSLVIKGGTKIKSIRLVAGYHYIDCKVDGQSTLLKSEFMKI